MITRMDNRMNIAKQQSAKSQRIAAADPVEVALIRMLLADAKPLSAQIDKRALLRAGPLDQSDGPNKR